MKARFTKRNIVICIIFIVVQTILRKISIETVLKKNGWEFNPNTRRWEKKVSGFGASVVAAAEETEMESKIAIVDLIVGIVGCICGLVLHYTVIDR